jgi:transcriptional regulator with XRE-family HTH domain
VQRILSSRFSPAKFAKILRARGWGKKQEAAEAFLGISQAMISKYLNGKAIPPDRTIENMAEKLSIPLESLLADDIKDPASTHRGIPGAVEEQIRALNRQKMQINESFVGMPPVLIEYFQPLREDWLNAKTFSEQRKIHDAMMALLKNEEHVDRLIKWFNEK